MVSDVPIGVFLSGGIDSSTVTALMARETTEAFPTFSIGFDIPEHSETDYARQVAEQYGTEHHERIVGVESVREILPMVGAMFDEPYGDGSAVPTLRVSSLARNHVKVVLSGDGGDEIFAGYNWYSIWLRQRQFDRVPLPIRRYLCPRLGSVWPRRWRGKRFLKDLAVGSFEQYARLLELFSPAEKRRILSPDWVDGLKDYDDYWYFRRYWREDVDPLTRIQYVDVKTYLPDDILTKVDRVSMAVSLEVRPPLLDHPLVEQLFSIPGHLRAPNGEKKHLLKAAARELLPPSILERRKKGFSAPWTPWMRTDREWATQRLSSNGLPKAPLQSGVTELPDLFDQGIKVWALLLLREWSCHELRGKTPARMLASNAFLTGC
jgi:asparagine synthase (glutamine-hydrolysing)